ncbi:MAG: TonB-dependent receptor [Prevotella sp.]|uniref:TonB-dependent receptor n=1 Tax=Prevotella sp. TaxID=59823 RepID=UPI002A2CEA57|nr:TonB-dependent receptor [Prevotella sp.]MDD7317437.1 TonB-dependent receptor [Prevotellaceae bacterium]MDY4019535.1 TonB-dependent receptor [Prevotella sp.]
MKNWKASVGLAVLLCPVLVNARTGSGHAMSADSIKKQVNLVEVTVVGKKQAVSMNTVSDKINEVKIRRSLGRSLASMLEEVGGVSSIQTGTVIAKPVIHGMYGNRIAMIADGAVLTGQQWGEDHAPELDKNAYSGIRVVKGAQSVRYGAEALGGIILMESQSLPYYGSTLNGKSSLLYGTNGRQTDITLQVEGAMPWCRQLAWRAHATYANSGDHSTARYLLNNTGIREYDLSLAVGYKTKRMTVEAGYSLFNQHMGVMLSAQMGSEDLLKERIALGRPVYVDPFTRHIDYPKLHVAHHTAKLKVVFDGAAYGSFQWQTTFQQDNRTENRIRRMNHSKIPAVSLHLSSWQHTLDWSKTYGRFQTDAGVKMLLLDNTNARGTGVVPVIPNYTENTLGLYAVQQYRGNGWGVEAGLRSDWQQTKAAGYDWKGDYYGGRRRFGNISYSVSAHWCPAKGLKIVSDAGVAWRAPHVYELYSNGNELGSGMYVEGDSLMRPERGYKWITAVTYRNRWIDVSADVFMQWVNNYIYDEPQRQTITVISGTYPVFRYKQTHAFLRGADIDIGLTPVSWLRWRTVSTLIWANERGTRRYLPYIPSAHVTNWLTWQPHIRGLAGVWFTISHRFVAKQTHFDPATDLVDFTPPAYHLFGFDAGVAWNLSKDRSLEVALQGFNVLNKEYKEYTNRSRYYAHDMGRDIHMSVSYLF